MLQYIVVDMVIVKFEKNNCVMGDLCLYILCKSRTAQCSGVYFQPVDLIHARELCTLSYQLIRQPQYLYHTSIDGASSWP